MRIHVRRSVSGILAIAMLGAVTVLATATPAAASSSTVVDYGQLAPTGSWRLESPGSSTGTFSFVDGPAPTPSGTGSLAMSIADGQHEWLEQLRLRRLRRRADLACTEHRRR